MALQLLMRCLHAARVKNGRKEHAVLDALGWMELHFRPEKNLIVTGLNEGIVPEGGMADQFMPEPLRESLGMDSFSRKKARDSFLLTALDPLPGTGGKPVLRPVPHRAAETIP